LFFLSFRDLPYGQDSKFSSLMTIRGASTENAPEPLSSKLWASQLIKTSKHGLGYSVERTNGEWSRPNGAKKSFESAMNYFFADQPPMSDEMGEFEGRAQE
jgi:hypothetical protein